jgi:hypothetical protein
VDWKRGEGSCSNECELRLRGGSCLWRRCRRERREQRDAHQQRHGRRERLSSIHLSTFPGLAPDPTTPAPDHPSRVTIQTAIKGHLYDIVKGFTNKIGAKCATTRVERGTC